MLRITVELVPYGQESLARQIAIGEIINDGTGDFEHGNYKAEFLVIKDHMTGKPIQFTSTVKGFSRVRNVWSLICEAISNVKE